MIRNKSFEHPDRGLSQFLHTYVLILLDRKNFKTYTIGE
jgi:hypothetical protein